MIPQVQVKFPHTKRTKNYLRYFLGRYHHTVRLAKLSQLEPHDMKLLRALTWLLSLIPAELLSADDHREVNKAEETLDDDDHSAQLSHSSQPHRTPLVPTRRQLVMGDRYRHNETLGKILQVHYATVLGQHIYPNLTTPLGMTQLLIALASNGVLVEISQDVHYPLSITLIDPNQETPVTFSHGLEDQEKLHELVPVYLYLAALRLYKVID